MAYIFRDFDINKGESRRGDIGNIEVSFVEPGILQAIVFGIYGVFSFAPIRIKFPETMDLYEACSLILDIITQDFRINTYEGYVDCMLMNNDKDDLPENREYLRDGITPQFDFTKENVKYLMKYPNPYAYDDDDKLIEGEIYQDGNFDYDFKSLLEYDAHLDCHHS